MWLIYFVVLRTCAYMSQKRVITVNIPAQKRKLTIRNFSPKSYEQFQKKKKMDHPIIICRYIRSFAMVLLNSKWRVKFIPMHDSCLSWIPNRASQPLAKSEIRFNINLFRFSLFHCVGKKVSFNKLDSKRPPTKKKKISKKWLYNNKWMGMEVVKNRTL